MPSAVKGRGGTWRRIFRSSSFSTALGSISSDFFSSKRRRSMSRATACTPRSAWSRRSSISSSWPSSRRRSPSRRPMGASTSSWVRWSPCLNLLKRVPNRLNGTPWRSPSGRPCRTRLGGLPGLGLGPPALLRPDPVLQGDLEDLLHVLDRVEVQLRRTSGAISSRSFWLAKGMMMFLMPTRRAARAFSLSPPMARASPRRSISPVMAKVFFTGTPLSTESSTVAMASPALGPSLGIAPSGKWMCRSFFWNTSGSISKASPAAADVAEGGLGALLHHVAQLAGEHQCALAGHLQGFHEQHFAAGGGPGQARHHAHPGRLEPLVLEHTPMKHPADHPSPTANCPSTSTATTATRNRPRSPSPLECGGLMRPADRAG